MKNKIVCMIPARLGSKRIPKKNLRYLNDKPLIAWVIEAAFKAACFDEIYINSESDEFKPLAEQYGIKFYKRPEELSTDQALNDDFAFDFIKNVECDYLVQLLPTGPFISVEEIRNFVESLPKFNTLISVKKVQIECLYGGQALNFSNNEKTLPSQALSPVQAYACTLMGWKKTDYVSNMEKKGFAYHGCDNIGLFELNGNSVIDIDNEEDWAIAEAIATAKKTIPIYYGQSIESSVPSILKNDGVNNNDLFDVNHLNRNIKDIINRQGNGSWSVRIVDSPSNSATLISQMPGEGNRMHFHPNWNEWWYILKGEWEFTIEGVKHIISKDSIIFIEQGKKHRIESLGDENGEASIRLAVSRADVPHVYLDNLSMWAEAAKAHINTTGEIFGYSWGDPESERAHDSVGTLLGNYKFIKDNYVIPFIENKRVLEIASLSGKWTQYLKPAKEIIYSDCDENLFHIVKKLIDIPTLEFYQLDGYNLAGIPDNSVDFVFEMDSFMRISKERIITYIKEVIRVLKSDGKACLHLPCNVKQMSCAKQFTEIELEEIEDVCKELGMEDKFSIDIDTCNHGVLLLIGY